MGKLVAFIYLDTSKAFDSMSHMITLAKLETLGLAGNRLVNLKLFPNGSFRVRRRDLVKF